AYVETNLVGTGKVSQAAILGIKQKAIWGQQKDEAKRVKEISKAVDAFNNLEATRTAGVTISGVRYIVTVAEENLIRGMKGQHGCILVKTTQTVLVALYDNNVQAQECSAVVEGLGAYLRSVNF
ncbi:profilin, partial [Serendipita vermifera]